MRISVLNENLVSIRGYVAEHGLSVLIEHKGKRYLFDTGQTDCFMQNAVKMGISLGNLDAIILSHGHYDHTGGLWFLAQKYGLAPVYAGKGAFSCKCRLNADGRTYRDIGTPWTGQKGRNEVRGLLPGVNPEEESRIFRLNNGRLEIGRDAVLLTDIPHTVSWELPEGEFYIRKEDSRGGQYVQDTMKDEQVLVIKTEKGLAVFCGCAHPGIANCLSYVEKEFRGEHIYLLFAGMHLKQKTERQVEQVIQAIREYDIDIIMPVHCTGIMAIAKIKLEFGGRCILMETGKVFDNGKEQ